MLTFSNELKKSYKIPVMIFAASVVFYMVSISTESLDLSLITRIGIVNPTCSIYFMLFNIQKLW